MSDPEITVEPAHLAGVFAPQKVVGPPSTIKSELDGGQMRVLKNQGFPDGLARELGRSRVQCPQRFWVIDNSGSMNSSDGNELRETAGKLITVSCTRWKELQSTVQYHIDLAALLHAPTTFILINDPGSMVGPQEFTVNGPADQDQAKNIINKARPTGTTPMTKHINEIYNRIFHIKDDLRTHGQQAVVVIATDGLPNNPDDFKEALRKLHTLPVWVVIRLCTDSDSVVKYYNELDSELETGLEVIDDFWSEGAEVHNAKNKWINYTIQLHRAREMGYHNRLLDFIDEQALTADQAIEYMTLIFGQERMANMPDIHVEWGNFAEKLRMILEENGTPYNPNLKKPGFWIDVDKLKQKFGPDGMLKAGFKRLGLGKSK